MTLKHKAELLDPYFGTYVTATVTIINNDSTIIFEDTAEGILEPDQYGYIIRDTRTDRKTFFAAQVVYDLSPHGKIVIFVEMR